MDLVATRNQFVIWNTSMTNYFQYSHLLNVKYINNGSVFISKNNFQNISTAGSLIYFEENVD